MYCNDFEHYIPLTFVLGFYVNLVIQRWWEQFMHVAWPDAACRESTHSVH